MNKSNKLFKLAIIGGGAAGLYLANKLREKENIILIESGGIYKYTKNNPNHNYFISKKSSHKIKIDHFSGIGGNTSKWGGQLLPFSENDINKLNGWPMDFKDLAENYENISKELLGQSINFYSLTNIVNSNKLNIFNLNNKNLRIHVSGWLRKKNFKKLFFKFIKNKITIMDNYYVDYLENNENGFYKIYCKNKNSTKVIRAQKVVITCGAIQSVRLLMNSISCGNIRKNINLGKGFMDHATISKLRLVLKNRYKFLSLFNTKYLSNGNKLSIRISASDTFLKESDYNISAMIKVNPPKNFFKRFINLITVVLTKDILNFIYKPFGEVVLCFFIEQKISKTKNIFINSDGFPILQWVKDEKEVEQLQKFQKIIIKSFLENDFIEESSYYLNNEQIINDIKGNNHPMGGAIMHNEEKKSVVDPNLQIIGCENLYLCSTAIFPSGSFSNPTMTLLAFADRLSQKLKMI